jgi:hypothetical protein
MQRRYCASGHTHNRRARMWAPLGGQAVGRSMTTWSTEPSSRACTVLPSIIVARTPSGWPARLAPTDHGKVSVSSTFGSGSAFTLELPRAGHTGV